MPLSTDNWSIHFKTDQSISPGSVFFCLPTGQQCFKITSPATTGGTSMCTWTVCRRQLVLLGPHANIRKLGQQAVIKVQSVVSRLTNNKILVIRKHVKETHEWYFELKPEKQTQFLIKYYISIVLQLHIYKWVNLHILNKILEIYNSMSCASWHCNIINYISYKSYDKERQHRTLWVTLTLFLTNETEARHCHAVRIVETSLKVICYRRIITEE